MQASSPFTPKLATTLHGYSREQLMRDLTAGVIVGVVAIPLSIAFAIASGVTPDRGLYTAIVAGFIISALGGSRVQIGGPTGAFVVIVYGIVQRYGVGGLTAATLMAGILLVGFGAARLGTTRTAAAIELWLPRLGGSVVAIGNAPTALFRLLEAVAAGAPL